MVDLRSPRSPLTVQLPDELIKELQILAREKGVTLDDLVTEACLAFSEPHVWEREFKSWQRTHPEEAGKIYGVNGDEIFPQAPGEDRA